MSKIKCNNCNWIGDEDDLVLVEFDAEDSNEVPTAVENSIAVTRFLPEPEEVDYLKGCPDCMTDSYLTNLVK